MKIESAEFDRVAYRVTNALESIARALQAREVSQIKDMLAEPTETETLQARAEYNRANAAMLYHDSLMLDECNTGVWRWVEKATGEPVVFTPHGWRVQSEVETELGRKL